ncbi:MAG: putative bifunctional diguanylate cyclase/phosphodiesterase [Burkholderiales bacterium]
MIFRLPRTMHMRIMLGVSLLQLLVVGLFSLYMVVEMVSNEVANRRVQGHKIISMTAQTVENMLAAKDMNGLQRFIEKVGADPSVAGIWVRNGRGSMLFQQARWDSVPHVMALWVDSNIPEPRISSELRVNGRASGTVSIELSNEQLNDNIDNLLANVGYLFLILLAIDLIATQLLVKHFVSPLGPLAALGSKVADGEWDELLPVSQGSSLEVQALTSAFVRSAGVMRDQIAELERTRGQLAIKEEKLRNLVGNMREVLLEMDSAGCITFLNPAWEMLTGYALETSLGAPFASFLVQPQQQDQFTRERLPHIKLNELQLEIRSRNGISVWLQMNTSLQHDAHDGFSGLVSTLEDITENLRLQQLQRQHEENLYHLTITDPLTGVYNRRHFDDLLANMLPVSLHRAGQLGLLIIDVDGFKFINDTYGHPVGDDVLRAIAVTLAREKFKGVPVARLAGDEFAVIIENAGELEAHRLATEIHDELRRIRIGLPVGQLEIQVSVGVAVAPLHGKTPMDLVRSADVALFHAKKSGRNRVYTLSAEVGEAVMEIFSQGFELRGAVQDGLIAPFMQPIVDLETGAVMAYEVLTRLKRGDGYVGADHFVTVAEELGLIREMDLFVIKETLRLVPKHIHLFLNISLNSFIAPEFAHQLRDLLQSPDARGRSITLEFTERQTTELSEDFIAMFAELRAGGCKIALDDFGVGYSTYSYVRMLKPDFVKIDGSFVQQIRSNPQDVKIVDHIRELSETFGAKSIAEHVEDEETLLLLRQLGVDYGQGYYFGRPVSVHDQLWSLQAVAG